MKKVKFRHSVTSVLLVSIAIFVSFTTLSFAQEGEAAAQEETASADSDLGDPAAGKELFNSQCAACHRPYKKMVGPPLHGITERLDKEWIYEWIHDSRGMIEAGDPDAVAIFEEYNGLIMPHFPQLSEKDMDDILAYVEQPKPEPAAGATAQAGGASGGGDGGLSSSVVLGLLAFVLLILIIILVLVNKTLNRFAEANNVPIVVEEKGKPIWKSFVENQFLVLVSACVLLLTAAYFGFGGMMQVGVDQEYQPVQPIHFSHRIHAGENQIDCKFCHSSARTSKMSGVPSLNVCMNCHITISEVAPETATEDYSKEFYDAEIAKLYAATGWDPAAQDYVNEPQPVKWIRVHNLPDFAYYNHAQHVNVAGIQCQQCHGPVEEMEVLYQYSPLTMGWCISCHKETDVRMEGNEYYENVHDQLAEKYGVEKVTVAQMGGIECAKCHF